MYRGRPRPPFDGALRLGDTPGREQDKVLGEYVIHFVRLVAAICMLVPMIPAALAQSWPARPIHFIVPFAPGGQSDIVARTVAEKLAAKLGQPVVVENKAGAATTIGADYVAKSAPDGYTILLAPAPFVITQYAYPKLPYDTRKDFVPVTLLVTNPMVVTVNAAVPAKTFGEFVALMKAQPGKFNYGSPGNGSLPHVATEMFIQRAGLDAVHVPYKGGGPAVIDLVGGQIPFMFASPLEVMQHVKAGKLRVLAATSPARLPYWPEVPTVMESGYPDYQALAWFGVVAPAATPREIVARLASEITAILGTAEVRERLAAQGADVALMTSEEFGRFLGQEHARWSAAVKSANIRIE